MWCKAFTFMSLHLITLNYFFHLCALIKGTPKSLFANQPMGKNYLSETGKNNAELLNLDNPETYTGHCFCRTAATMAFDVGATAHQL